MNFDKENPAASLSQGDGVEFHCFTIQRQGSMYGGTVTFCL